MFLSEILLPMYDNTGARFPQEAFEQIRSELTGHFGGVTAFVRSPALGLWRDDAGTVRHDEITIFEVMTAHLDHPWWAAYREHLEQYFRQEQIVVRAVAVQRL